MILKFNEEILKVQESVSLTHSKVLRNCFPDRKVEERKKISQITNKKKENMTEQI